jgi:multiple antibiotic resistance protein
LVRELLIALLVLVVFMFCGPWFMQALNISETSLCISGGIILFMIAIKMVFGHAGELWGADVGDEPFVVPLAVPLLAGPSALATLVLLVGQAPDRRLEWLAALLLAWGSGVVILMSGQKIRGVLGKKGLAAVERLMGLLLTTVSVEMCVRGLHDIFGSTG